VLEPDSPGGTYFTVPIAEIETPEVCRGNSGATAGGMVGGLIGGAVGYVLASKLSAEASCTGDLSCLDTLGQETAGRVLLAGFAIGGGSVVSFLLGQGIGRLLAGRPSRFLLPRSRGAMAPATSHDPCGPSRASPSFSGASHETGDPNER
jgi:predicted lipid-binding transport protein (Tim44 family)